MPCVALLISFLDSLSGSAYFCLQAFKLRKVGASVLVIVVCDKLYIMQEAIFLSWLIANPQSKPPKSESLVFGWEYRWLSCWWQPLCLLSGFLLLWDKIHAHGEGWGERNPHRLSLVYLDFSSQPNLSHCQMQVGDLGKNVDYCCNRYCCCQLTYGQSGRMRNGRKGNKGANTQ